MTEIVHYSKTDWFQERVRSWNICKECGKVKDKVCMCKIKEGK